MREGPQPIDIAPMIRVQSQNKTSGAILPAPEASSSLLRYFITSLLVDRSSGYRPP
jgi:hypothetical protein